MKTFAMTMLGAAVFAASPAAAETVTNTQLQNINRSIPIVGINATTTTNATGTRTTSTGSTRVSATAPASQTWHQANVGGGGTVGITTDYARNGNGSAYFATTGGASKGDLQYNFGSASSLVQLSSFSSISYDFFRDASSTAGDNYAPVFRLDIYKQTGNAAATFAGSLVSEYLYQNQTVPPEGAWTTLASTQSSGIWWATNAALGPTFAAANGGQKTLEQWIADNSGSTLYVSGYNIGVGSGWNGTLKGAIDNIAITSARGTENFNFEVAGAGAVPEPATWAMLILGFGMVGASLRARKAAGGKLALSCR